MRIGNELLDRLKPVSHSIELPAVDMFFVDEHFQRGKYGILLVSDSFADFFYGMREPHTGETQCRSFDFAGVLNQSSFVDFVASVGRGRRVNLALGHIAELISRQSESQPGELRTDVLADNLFYAFDRSGELRRVWAIQPRSGPGWHINSSPIEYNLHEVNPRVFLP